MKTANSMRSRQWTSAPAAVLGLWLFVCFCGCTAIKDSARGTARTVADTTRKVTRTFTAGGSDLRHRIALIGIENQPAARPFAFPGFFQKSLAGFLASDCPEIVVDAAVGELLQSPPRLASGQIDGYALAVIGRPRGLNFFVIGTLSDTRLMEEKTGFWLWKDTRYKIRAVLRLEVIDSGTGTKTLDETFSEEAVIDELRHQQLQEGGPLPFEAIEPILNRLLPQAGNTLCGALGQQPWQGFIVGARDGRITLSSGSAVGLSVGRKLEVYASGRMVEGREGLRLLQPGERAGEAQIVAVSPDRAEADVSPPAAGGPGGTVRLK
jgi:hypothetical protein